MTPTSLALALTLTAFLITALALRPYIGWARQQLLDSPNGRSAHAAPTPTGGGLVFLSMWIVALAIAGGADMLDRRAAIALALPALLLMLVGWFDDRRPLGAGLRLTGQFLCAAIFLALAPWPAALPADVPGILAALPIALVAMVALFYLVYSTNITNFMDGIDGIVALQVLGFAGWALAIMPNRAELLVPTMLIAACTGAFLLYNRPRARLFMGDSGSAPLGLILAALTLLGLAQSLALGAALLALQGVFVADSAVTLLRRILRRQNPAQAHSEHAYQHAARRHGHARVSYTLGAVTALVGGPVAWGIAGGPLPPLAALLLLLIYCMAAWQLRAGTPRTD